MFVNQVSLEQSANTLEKHAEEFLTHGRVELRFSKETITKYRDCIRQVQKFLGKVQIKEISKADVLRFKASLLDRRLSTNRQVTILLALRRYLQFLREDCHIEALDPLAVIVPRRPRREVIYLTTEEVERFVTAIKLTSAGGSIYVPGLRFRALVEVLLGSAMRISELLSLNRLDLNLESGEAKVIGKGGKERVVFFTSRALHWIKRYLDSRTDTHPALFVCQGGVDRLKRPDVWRPFVRYRQFTGIQKRVTAHMLRHTAATQLLFNGCPVAHIKEILGHERLETTCRYYLGLDRRAAKQALHKYLVYSSLTA